MPHLHKQLYSSDLLPACARTRFFSGFLNRAMLYLHERTGSKNSDMRFAAELAFRRSALKAELTFGPCSLMKETINFTQNQTLARQNEGQ